MEMKRTLCFESPAKVNLRLEIVRKRKDGYHELRTIFQKISLHDTLRLSLRRESGIVISADHPNLPTGKENLVYQAAQLLLKRADYKGGIGIKIDKRIPLGAGLGGGSSNAAATLKAVSQLLEMEISSKELMKMGLEIGADVPFFLLEGDAIGSGIGERLRKIELPPLWYVLIYPNFEVSTAWAYQNFVLTKSRIRLKIQKFLTTPEKISQILKNDLEKVVSSKYPHIETMKDILRSSGALGSLMTGSGPTVFGLFSEEGGASEAYKKIKEVVKERGWIVLKAHSILA